MSYLYGDYNINVFSTKTENYFLDTERERVSKRLKCHGHDALVVEKAGKVSSSGGWWPKLVLK